MPNSLPDSYNPRGERPTRTKGGNCLVGCIPKFTCPPIELPIQGESIAPWVKCKFGKQEDGDLVPLITVGNKSAPGLVGDDGLTRHHAAIKSMEYGTMGGHKMQLEIIDEEGGAFHEFGERLLKCIDRVSKEYYFQVQWGWIVRHCDDSLGYERSPIITFHPTNLEVSFSDGVIKYNITGTDSFQITFVAREDEAYGTEQNPLALKAAIREMMQNNEPIVTPLFKRREADGTIVDWCYDKTVSDCEGPRSAWTSDNQNKMATAKRWHNPFRTNDDKGCAWTWDNMATNPQAILWEDTSLDCERPQCNPSIFIGTFIVNGGKCSNVISFNPNINWPAAFANLVVGGEHGASWNAHGHRFDNQRPTGCKVQNEHAGLGSNTTNSRGAYSNLPPEQLQEYTGKSQQANDKANAALEATAPIEAELTIQGNPLPKFCDVKKIQSQYASVVVINPFHLTGPNDLSCGDWKTLTKSMCNDMLSNRFWHCKGVSHQIKEGSYVTKLKLYLSVPGIELPSGEPLGGDPHAWTPPNTC